MNSSNKHIVWTRSPDSSSELFAQRCPGQFTVLPILQRHPISSELRRCSEALHSCSEPGPFLMLTSPYAAQLLRDLTSPTAHVHITSFSSSTLAYLKLKGWNPYPLPKQASLKSGKDLAGALKEHLSCTYGSAEVWFLGAQEPAWDYKMIFASATSLTFRHFSLYRTQALPLHRLEPSELSTVRSLPQDQLVTTFCSPSAFRGYHTLNLPLGGAQLVIGNTTAQALRAAGLQPWISPHPTPQALASYACDFIEATKTSTN